MALSRLQVLSVGLVPSTLEQGVSSLSAVRAAGRLQVEGLRRMWTTGMSRKPEKFKFLEREKERKKEGGREGGRDMRYEMKIL